MTKLNDYKIYELNNNKYTICSIKYKSTYVPIIIDYKFIRTLINMNKSWRINNKGHVITNHTYVSNGNEINCEIYLHDVILTLNKTYKSKPVLHINRLGVDNRIENLIYDEYQKDIKKNIKKKSRSIVLPKSSHINPDDIPSFVWYLKEDQTHGERFMIELGEIRWKTTSSKGLSLRYKLEEAKKFLRHLKIKRPDLFETYSMNGDLNKEGQKLLESFYKISFNTGFTHLKIVNLFDKTNEFLEEDLNYLSDNEIELLNVFNPNK